MNKYILPHLYLFFGIILFLMIAYDTYYYLFELVTYYLSIILIIAGIIMFITVFITSRKEDRS
ncbi:hypothetical protein [Pseudogracilibacillus auburnensis]|uniref:hypothetical protein n=1 Tax=Pseudogracilibacillus auburnensis TaxID=1494959 RepID=UPI001A966696|nr:hypothetical protein [Pseudogracilibacillus auburnensis]MBO1001263.1 hypothetical protein [Pseudogracilibacillus auburnensis]